MKTIQIQEVGIGLYGITGNYGGPHERNCCELWFVLYDQSKYSTTYLEEHQRAIHQIHEEETPQVPLEICFLHEVDVRLPLNTLSESIILEENNALVLNHDYYNDYSQGAHICAVNPIPQHITINEEANSFIELNCGYFVFDIQTKLPQSVSEFNQHLTLSNANLLNDWQKALVPKDQFFEIYTLAIEKFQATDFSTAPLEEEYGKFFFFV